uniref:Albino-3 n=1 Tax=Neurospora crassa TaxID=5141 RepID=Q870A6_NEUCS|nr:albino-3 [Neurospora crassa]
MEHVTMAVTSSSPGPAPLSLLSNNDDFIAPFNINTKFPSAIVPPRTSSNQPISVAIPSNRISSAGLAATQQAQTRKRKASVAPACSQLPSRHTQWRPSRPSLPRTQTDLRPKTSSAPRGAPGPKRRRRF